MAVGDLDWLIWANRRKANARQLRLFACACCRRLWPLLEDERSRRAVVVSERFADGLVSRKALAAARASAPARGTTRARDWAAKAAAYATAAGAYYAAEKAAGAARQAAAGIAHEVSLVSLLQHIVAAVPVEGVAVWPADVVQLAASLYAGEDCAFAVHDALLEAGHTKLAEHFQEREHPKGCRAVDLILGKK